MKVIRGAEIGSDHHLVLMKVIICGRSKMKRKERSCQLRSERLQTKEGKMRFRARLGHLMYNAKHPTGEDIERAWGEFKGTAEAVWERKDSKKMLSGRRKERIRGGSKCRHQNQEMSTLGQRGKREML